MVTAVQNTDMSAQVEIQCKASKEFSGADILRIFSKVLEMVLETWLGNGNIMGGKYSQN